MNRPLPLLLAALLVLVASLAQAQQGGAPKVSTRDEYRSCLDEQEALKRQLPALQASHQEHKRALKQLQDEMDAHVATQSALDTTNQQAVDAFNARLGQLNERAEQLNARGDDGMKAQDGYNARVAAANKRCASLVVNVRDRDAVAKERAVQGARK